jgi:hypothetical protein
MSLLGLQLHFFQENGSAGLIFHLQCPDSDDKAVTDLYHAQETVLNGIVELDQAQIVSRVQFDVFRGLEILNIFSPVLLSVGSVAPSVLM